ncbi:MAG: peptidase M16 [Desulfofustis sp.]|nr:peptidase M16 [Desulfofustis sp.]
MQTRADTTIANFKLKEHQYIAEIGSDVHLFEHSLGCPLMAIKNGDTNKTFAAAFNTTPTDSTGVAHILEHSVLMGSRKYPVKDVFGEMNKGGLMTFLNAMTGADITYYPFATRNLKEYFNLMDVYCDVVFNPLLEPETFEQEGWHYHKENLKSPLQFQGVVFNEMKGAFSDPIRLIFHHIFGGLMPGSTYAHESGGDPRIIPDLSYEQFCDFHRKHYHPSNCTLFVYGDAPLEEELEFLDDRFLNQYESKAGRSRVDLGIMITSPTTISDFYGVESADTKERTYLAVGTHVGTVADREKNGAFQIIANILFNSDGSPLKNKILATGICKDFGGLYLSSSCFNTVMITYLVGSEKKHLETFSDVYRQTLEEIVADGLAHDLLVAELNKYEFGVREDASKAQRGLDLLSKSLAALKYGTNPFEALQNEKVLKSIRKKALNEKYFEELIKGYLVDNPSTVTVALEPDPEKNRRTAHEEQERIDLYESGLDSKELDSLVVRTKELIARQQRANDDATLSKLPQLELADLPAQVDFHVATPEKLFGQQTLISELPTNRISYLDIGFDLSHVPADYLPLLDLFGTITTEIGTGKLDYMQFAKEVATCTGGLTHSINTYTTYGEPDSVRPVLWINAKMLPEYLERGIDLLSDIFSDLSLKDRSRIGEIVRREFAWAEHSTQSEGYGLASTRVFSHLSPAGRYQEHYSGVTAYRRLKELALGYQGQEDEFLSILERLSEMVLNRANMVISFTGEDQEIEILKTTGQRIVDALADHPVAQTDDASAPEFVREEAFITAAEVVFVVQGGNLFEAGNGYKGSFEVLKTYLSRDYLWNSVRQIGGAYGCFIQFSSITGNMAMISYRDPQVRKTYDAYDRLPEVVADIDLSPQALEQLIIGTYGNFDPHQSAAAKGVTARNDYLCKITPEHKRQRLQEITSTSVEDLRSFAGRIRTMTQNRYRAIIGNRAKIEADRDLFESITEI